MTDGTPQGTGPLSGLPAPSDFAVLGDRLLFTTPLPGAPLWEWDGTEAVHIRDLAPGWRGDWELLTVGPRVFFLAGDPDTGLELWAVEEE